MLRRFFLVAALCLLATPAFSACGFGSSIGGGQCQGIITNGTTSFTVPTDWTATNQIEVIGAGGGGGFGNNATGPGQGGGGGAYSSISNTAAVTLGGTGASVTVAVGAGGVGGTSGATAGTAGTGSWFCNSATNCATIGGTAVIAGSNGGAGGAFNANTGGAGGTAPTGTVKTTGGSAGTVSVGNSNGSGGGGAAGRLGVGAAGGIGPTVVSTFGSGGGGGNGGGNIGSNGAALNTGGAGGTNQGATGGGTAGPATTPYSGGNGSNGGGGGGGGNGSLALSANGCLGGNGSTGTEWPNVSAGSGGGGGGGGSCTAPLTSASVGGAGGLYGGGGGGGGDPGTTGGLTNVAVGGAGGNGIIVVTYTAAVAGGPAHNNLMQGIVYHPRDDLWLIDPINLRFHTGSSGSGGGHTPVVASLTCNISSPLTNGSAVVRTQAAGSCQYTATCNGGSCTGGDAITLWSISGQSCASCYSISSSGVLQGGSNAANVTTEVDTVTITATNATGTSPGVTQTVNVWADGSITAQVGTPQHATLLSGYTTRPAWNVPGVDYLGGPPTALSLTTPSTVNFTADGITTSTFCTSSCGGGTGTGGYIVITAGTVGQMSGNTCTKGYDFTTATLANGWQVEISGNNVIVQCSKFKQTTTAGSMFNVDTTAPTIHVRYNSFDGNGGAIDANNFEKQLIFLNVGGTTTLDHNYVFNGAGRLYDMASPTSGTQALVDNFNVYENCCDNAATTSHGDETIISAGASDAGNWTAPAWNFNLLYVPNKPLNGGTEGIFWQTNISGNTVLFHGGSFNNNTIVALTPSPPLSGGNAGLITMLGVGTNTIATGTVFTVNNNFADPSGNQSVNGAPGNFLDTSNGGSATGTGTVTNTGNTNMVNGATCDHLQAANIYRCQ